MSKNCLEEMWDLPDVQRAPGKPPVSLAGRPPHFYPMFPTPKVDCIGLGNQVMETLVPRAGNGPFPT